MQISLEFTWIYGEKLLKLQVIGDTIGVAKDLMNNTQKLPRVPPREFYFALFIDQYKI